MADPSAAPDTASRLRLNRGGYRGERIPVRGVLDQLRDAAIRANWVVNEVARAGDLPIWGFSRPVARGHRSRCRIYISAGLHGDEPAGPLAALRLLDEDAWPDGAQIELLPCLNPAGMEGNRREGPEGVDLNRDYRNPKTSTVRAHVEWFEAQPRFTAALLLHEDWEADGFYLYELARQGNKSMASSVISAVSRVCPILQASHADDWPAKNGVVRPSIDPAARPEWPEAFYAFMNKTDACSTFEAPSDYPMSMRVSALVAAVNRALQLIVHSSAEP